MMDRLLFLTFLASSTALAAESTCYGTTGNGRLENGVKLPIDGKNFFVYGAAGAAAGRTYVHSKVFDVVVAAYQTLAQANPEKVFVYGETGFASGGRIPPHRTHRNGLSVDFMVPVVDASDKSVPLPAHALNRYGYGIEFDTDGKFEQYTIDFEAMAEHLYQLRKAAIDRDVGMALVIFDIALRPKLFATRRGAFLQKNLPFLSKQAWTRHDEHYHVDFAVPCKSIPKG